MESARRIAQTYGVFPLRNGNRQERIFIGGSCDGLSVDRCRPALVVGDGQEQRLRGGGIHRALQGGRRPLRDLQRFFVQNLIHFLQHILVHHIGIQRDVGRTAVARGGHGEDGSRIHRAVRGDEISPVQIVPGLGDAAVADGHAVGAGFVGVDVDVSGIGGDHGNGGRHVIGHIVLLNEEILSGQGLGETVPVDGGIYIQGVPFRFHGGVNGKADRQRIGIAVDIDPVLRIEERPETLVVAQWIHRDRVLDAQKHQGRPGLSGAPVGIGGRLHAQMLVEGSQVGIRHGREDGDGMVVKPGAVVFRPVFHALLADQIPALFLVDFIDEVPHGLVVPDIGGAADRRDRSIQHVDRGFQEDGGDRRGQEDFFPGSLQNLRQAQQDAVDQHKENAQVEAVPDVVLVAVCIELTVPGVLAVDLLLNGDEDQSRGNGKHQILCRTLPEIPESLVRHRKDQEDVGKRLTARQRIRIVEPVPDKIELVQAETEQIKQDKNGADRLFPEGDIPACEKQRDQDQNPDAAVNIRPVVQPDLDRGIHEVPSEHLQNCEIGGECLGEGDAAGCGCGQRGDLRQQHDAGHPAGQKGVQEEEQHALQIACRAAVLRLQQNQLRGKEQHHAEADHDGDIIIGINTEGEGDAVEKSPAADDQILQTADDQREQENAV